MDLCNYVIGFGITGSHCTIPEMFSVLENLKNRGADLYPIISYSVSAANTRFGAGEEWKRRIAHITGRNACDTIAGTEPLGPQKKLDLLLIAPCTGNTMAKLARGITDTPVLMAAKLQFRNNRPVLIAISTNDGLGINAISLGMLMNYKNVYFVPFSQDDPVAKPNSLAAKTELIPAAVEKALKGEQIQPLIRE